MPEPLTFKIITDADDSGIRKYDNSMGNLNVSSRKASSALNSFSRELLQAKSGADVAAAGAESLAHVFHQGIAGALVIGGFKVVSDQIKGMGELVRGVGEETASAVKQLERMGQPGNLADAVKGADMLDQKLDAVTKKLEGIQGGNWFSRMLADVTGTTKELEATEKTLENMRNSQIALGFATEKQNAMRMAGATDEEKALDAINQKYNDRVKIAERITDESAKAQAMEDINAIKSAESYDLKLKLQKKLEEQQQKIADAEDKVVKTREENVIRTGQIAKLLGAAGGSARGPGQRQTSFEIGMERQARQATEAQTRIEQQNAMFAMAKKLGVVNERGQITDLNKVRNALVEQRKAGVQEEVHKKYQNEQTKVLSDATKQQQQLVKEQNNTKDALADFVPSANGAKSAIDAMASAANSAVGTLQSLSSMGGGGGGPDEIVLNTSALEGILGDIYDLLDGTLSELKTYAHAT